MAQPHCLHVHVDIWQLNMFKLFKFRLDLYGFFVLLIFKHGAKRSHSEACNLKNAHYSIVNWFLNVLFHTLESLKCFKKKCLIPFSLAVNILKLMAQSHVVIDKSGRLLGHL